MIGSRGIGSHYGGIERVLDELCPRLVEFGHEIEVFADRDVKCEDRRGIRVIPVTAFGGKHFETLSRSIFSLWQAIGRCDVIHFHAVGPGILSSVTRLFGQRSFVTIHGLDYKRDKWGFLARSCLSLSERVLVANADQISVVAENLRRYFIERYDLATSFIPNGIPQKHVVPPGHLLSEYGLEAGRYILFASRLTPEKGCSDLIAAFNQIDTNMKLVIAGTATDPSYFDALQRQADSAKIVFIGHRVGDELAEFFSNAYTFVLPSYIEGMSMALLEAIAYKIPPLVTEIPENRAVVGDFGFYFPPRDIDCLRATLSSLITQPGRIATARERLQALSIPDWDAVAARYDKLYRDPVQRRSPVRIFQIQSGDVQQ